MHDDTSSTDGREAAHAHTSGHAAAQPMNGSHASPSYAADGRNSSSGSSSSGVSTSFMSPLFHFTAHDVTITAMEHDNHCKLLALATSRGEVYVTQTSEMPVIENVNLHMVKQAHEQQQQQQQPSQTMTQGTYSSGVPHASLVDPRLYKWDCAAMTALVDRMDGDVCTQLAWAPWQHGVCLAALCAGVQLRFYHFSHGRWALDTCVAAPGCVAFAFSAYLTVACACTHGSVELRSPRPAATATTRTTTTTRDVSAWLPCSHMRMTDADKALRDRHDAAATSNRDTDHDRNRVVAFATPATTTTTSADGSDEHADCLCVSWDDSGTLLAVGTRDGVVRVLYVVDDGSRLHHLVYRSHAATAAMTTPPSTLYNDNMGGDVACSHVVWSPLSGRSFCALAMVLPTRVVLVLFARPPPPPSPLPPLQQPQQPPSLPQQASQSSLHRGPAASSLHYAPVANTRAAAAASTTAAAAAAGLGMAASGGLASLHVLASTEVACDSVVKLSWNTTGTRFVTSHMDNTVRVWSLCITHTRAAAAATPPSSSLLRVTARHVSTVHPYHAIATR